MTPHRFREAAQSAKTVTGPVLLDPNQSSRNCFGRFDLPIKHPQVSQHIGIENHISMESLLSYLQLSRINLYLKNFVINVHLISFIEPLGQLRRKKVFRVNAYEPAFSKQSSSADAGINWLPTSPVRSRYFPKPVPGRSARRRWSPPAAEQGATAEQALLQALETFGEQIRTDPGSPCSRSVKGRGPAINSRIISSVQRSPTISKA